MMKELQKTQFKNVNAVGSLSLWNTHSYILDNSAVLRRPTAYMPAHTHDYTQLHFM